VWGNQPVPEVLDALGFYDEEAFMEVEENSSEGSGEE